MQEQIVSERRITHRLTASWNNLRNGQELPHQQHLDQISAGDLSDMWDCCFVVNIEEITEGTNNYTYSHLGTAIKGAYGRAELDLAESPPLASTRASRLHHAYRQVLETRRPVTLEGEYINTRGQAVKYRQCLVPFVGKRNEITAVLGGMRFKREVLSAAVAA